MTDEECSGFGRCHGAMAWCDRCGDVRFTCDCAVCDQHRCMRCHAIGTPEERERWSWDLGMWCFACEVAMSAEIAIRQDKDEVAAMRNTETAIAAWRDWQRREYFARRRR